MCSRCEDIATAWETPEAANKTVNTSAVRLHARKQVKGHPDWIHLEFTIVIQLQMVWLKTAVYEIVKPSELFDIKYKLWICRI